MKKFLKISAACLFAALVLSCEKTPEKKEVTAINITPASLTLDEGATQQLTAEVLPQGAEYDKIVWHSENESLVTVSPTGLVTAVKATSEPVKVIATIGKVGGFCAVTVNEFIVDVTGVELAASSAELLIGETCQIEAKVLPENASNKNVTYASSAEAVATVSATGLVTAVAEGNAKITVTTEDKGKTAEFDVTVVKGAQGFSETANCYITTEAGEYFFTPTKGSTSEAVDGIASAEVFWETVNTAEAPEVGTVVSAASYKDGKIWFTVTETKGNAVLAARDAAGDIVWSWHIMNTLEPVNEVTLSTGVVAMDRNLGALALTGDLSYGMIYEWGRKDPFPNGVVLEDGTTTRCKATRTLNSVNSNFHDLGVFVNGDEGLAQALVWGTIENTIKEPDIWVKGPGNGKGWDWYFYTDDGPTVEDMDARWGLGVEKTMYDPCPAGYKVPSKEDFELLAADELPLVGRATANGFGFNMAPGKGATYWVSSVLGEFKIDGYGFNVAANGTASMATNVARNCGAGIRCVKIK